MSYVQWKRCQMSTAVKGTVDKLNWLCPGCAEAILKPNPMKISGFKIAVDLTDKENIMKREELEQIRNALLESRDVVTQSEPWNMAEIANEINNAIELIDKEMLIAK